MFAGLRIVGGVITVVGAVRMLLPILAFMWASPLFGSVVALFTAAIFVSGIVAFVRPKGAGICIVVISIANFIITFSLLHPPYAQGFVITLVGGVLSYFGGADDISVEETTREPAEQRGNEEPAEQRGNEEAAEQRRNEEAAEQQGNEQPVSTDETGDSRRRTTLVSLTIGLAIIVGPPLWILFPATLVFEGLCKQRSGEHLYQITRAKSYVLIGEGASSDGFHLHHALDDVARKRVEFIEVVKDPNNYHQRNALNSVIGRHPPKGRFFRVSLGPANSPDCARRLSPMYGVRFDLATGECLRFTPITAATSRYRVEAVESERIKWYAPDIRANGVRVIDTKKGELIGEHMRFVRGSLLAFFLVGEENIDCPGVYGFSPTQIHRKVLLGEK